MSSIKPRGLLANRVNCKNLSKYRDNLQRSVYQCFNRCTNVQRLIGEPH